MSRSNPEASQPRLGEILLREGRVQPAQLRRALEMQQLIGGRIGTNLLEIGAIDEATLLSALGAQRSTCTVTAEELSSLDPELLRLLPSKLARRYRLVPYRMKGKTLFIASADPGDALREDEISFLTSSMVRTCLALELRVQLALRRAYRVKTDARFLHVAKRLAEGRTGESGAWRSVDGTPAGTGSRAPSAGASAAAASAQPAPRVAPSPAPSRPAASSPAASSPAASSPAASSSSITTASRPARTAPQRRVRPQATKPEVEFIELDTDDLALLRREAPPGEPAPAGPALAPTETAAAPILDEIEPPTEELVDFESRDGGMAAARTPEERLRVAARRLQEADIRDEIGDVLLDFAAADLRRRLLLIDRKGSGIVGWAAAGDGIDEAAVRELTVDANLPSIFSSLRDASSFWLGPLAPMPENRKLIAALGGEAPRDCVALPVVLRGKVVCYLYGDNGADGVAGLDLEPLRRLMRKAGVAFEVYILKHKIRTL